MSQRARNMALCALPSCFQPRPSTVHLMQELARRRKKIPESDFTEGPDGLK